MKYYLLIPQNILRDYNLYPLEAILYGFVRSFSRGCYLSVGEMYNKLNISRSQAYRAMRQLKEKHLIVEYRVHHQHVYQAVEPTDGLTIDSTDDSPTPIDNADAVSIAPSSNGDGEGCSSALSEEDVCIEHSQREMELSSIREGHTKHMNGNSIRTKKSKGMSLKSFDSSAGETHEICSAGETACSAGETHEICSAGETACSAGETACFTGETACTTGETACTAGETACSTGETACSTGETACTAGETECFTGETECFTGETACTAGETACTAGETNLKSSPHTPYLNKRNREKHRETEEEEENNTVLHEKDYAASSSAIEKKCCDVVKRKNNDTANISIPPSDVEAIEGINGTTIFLTTNLTTLNNRVETFGKRFWSEQIRCERICMRLKIAPDELHEEIRNFCATVVARGEYHPSYNKFVFHFTNWLRKRTFNKFNHEKHNAQQRNNKRDYAQEQHISTMEAIRIGQLQQQYHTDTDGIRKNLLAIGNGKDMH